MGKEMKEREGEDAGGKEREYREREGRRGNTEREREEGGIATRRRTEIQPAEWTVLIRIGVANELYRCVAVRCGAFQYTEETRASAGFAELKWHTNQPFVSPSAATFLWTLRRSFHLTVAQNNCRGSDGLEHRQHRNHTLLGGLRAYRRFLVRGSAPVP